MANHTVELRRADGTKIKIIARYETGSFSEVGNYTVNVSFCAPRKRTWIWVGSELDYKLRGMTIQEKKEFLHNERLKYVTEEEMQAAKMALWETMKP